MGKYKTNLIDKMELLNNTLKWIIIVVAFILFVLVIAFGIKFPEKTAKVKVAGKVDSIRVLQKRQNILTNQVKPEAEIKEEKKSVKNKKNRKRKPKNRRIKEKFINNFKGYQISGVAISKALAPMVYLKKEGKTKGYRVSDKVDGYTITSIHRTYIVLENKKEKYHLNYIN